MKTDTAVIIFYKAGGTGSADVSAEDIDELISDLSSNYITHLRDTGGPQAGGILDAVVEIFTNEAFKELTEIVKDGLIFDLIFNREKSIVLKPLIRAFQSIEMKGDGWDYTQVRFNFSDTTIVIYGAGRIFTSVVGRVFPEILKEMQNLEHPEFGFPSKIGMPILKAPWSEEGKDEWICPAGDGQEYNADECLTFWGLEYGSMYNRKLYDYENKVILDIEWD
ncbi:MAG: hypothetical protein MK105_15010 [Crocinitomicaceae bacterium]|nr:hypothetical protein [Crocinitomicaceae bacterium]